MELGMRYFTVEQRETLRHRLEERAALLREELGTDLKQDLSAEPELAAAQRDADELRDVEAALARLDRPDYGSCVACGADIPYERLHASPAANRCLGCQRRDERRAGHGI
jgi:RNA polymerase-binding transcription factor DksA